MAVTGASLQTQTEEPLTLRPKPFLKWAGGKGQLVDELLARIPPTFSTYFEPFIGGGALFFSLCPKQAVLFDVNEQLVNTYCVVRDRPEELISNLSQHVYEKDYFYRMRDADRSSDFSSWSTVQKASRFIYLNRTCFNGLYRVNSKGYFNVPFGRYTNPKIVDAENIRRGSEVLRPVEISVSDFSLVGERAQAGDFVYFDPPYVPLSRTASFTSFSAGGFRWEDQERLRELCGRLHEKGVKFMLSNSCTDKILNLYQSFHYHVVSAQRAINSVGDKRGKVNEIIITNY